VSISHSTGKGYCVKMIYIYIHKITHSFEAVKKQWVGRHDGGVVQNTSRSRGDGSRRSHAVIGGMQPRTVTDDAGVDGIESGASAH